MNTIDPTLLVPYPDERDVSTDELGWRALPPDATPAARARAEALWRPVTADRPCRCSGPCDHGQPCGEDDSRDGPCPGRLIHVDRQPGSMLSLTSWCDNYACDVCGLAPASDIGVDLPDLPWGEKTSEHGFRTFPDVRHPNFLGTWPGRSGDEDQL